LDYFGLTFPPPGSFTPFAHLATDITVRLKPFTDAPPVKAEEIDGILQATKIKIVVDRKKSGIKPTT
jgi:hypothetical protein